MELSFIKNDYTKSVTIICPFSLKQRGGHVTRAKSLVTEFSAQGRAVTIVSIEEIAALNDKSSEMNISSCHKQLDFKRSSLRWFSIASYLRMLGIKLPSTVMSRLIQTARSSTKELESLVVCCSYKCWSIPLKLAKQKNVILDLCDSRDLLFSTVKFKHLPFLEPSFLFIFFSKKIMRIMERRFFRQTNTRISFISSTDLSYYSEHTLRDERDESRLLLISNQAPLCALDVQPKGPVRFIFIGTGTYGPNRVSLLWIGSLLGKLFQRNYERDAPEFCVIGFSFPNWLKTVLNRLYPNTTFIESAPEISRVVKKSDISLCPIIIGAGTQNKIIESLAMGLVTVTNRKGYSGVVGQLADEMKNNLQVLDGSRNCWLDFLKTIFR